MAITFVKKGSTDFIIDKLSRTVVHTPIVKTIDFNGEETLTNSTASSIQAAFLRRNRRNKYDESGKIEQGSAYIIVKPEVATLGEDDIITVDSKNYRVKNNILRYSDDDNDTALYHYADLFLIS